MGKVKEPHIAEIVARNVRLIREAKGLTQKQLADKVQWRYQSMLTQIEKGHRGMGPQSLRKLAEALEVDPGLFYTENLLDDPMFSKKMGIIEIPKEDPYCFQLSLSSINCHYLQSIHPDFIIHSSVINTFPLLKKYIFSDSHRIIGAIVDIDDMMPEYSKGDIVCVDLDDVDVAECTKETKFVCRIRGLNAVYNVIINGDIAELREIPLKNTEKTPFHVDPRIGKSDAIIGKVLWKLNLYY